MRAHSVPSSEEMKSEISEYPNSETSRMSAETTNTTMSIQTDYRARVRQPNTYPSETSSSSRRSSISSDSSMSITTPQLEMKKPTLRDVAARLLGKRRHPLTSSSDSASSTGSGRTKPPKPKKKDLKTLPSDKIETRSTAGSSSSSSKTDNSDYSAYPERIQTYGHEN